MIHDTISISPSVETTIISGSTPGRGVSPDAGPNYTFIALYNSGGDIIWLNFTGDGALATNNGIPLASGEKSILLDTPSWPGRLAFRNGITGLSDSGTGTLVVQAY